jgi:hypothetical protein
MLSMLRRGWEYAEIRCVAHGTTGAVVRWQEGA